MNNLPIGKVVSGGFSSNLIIQLAVPIGDVRLADYLVIPTEGGKYYAYVVDLCYGPDEQSLAASGWEGLERPELGEYASQQALTALAEAVTIMFVPAGTPGLPVVAATIPPQRSNVFFASDADLAHIFGQAGGPRMVLGQTRNQGHPIPVQLQTLVQRSSGFFGATGTGKSFVLRLMMSGLLKKQLANLLVLDMHNEYGFPDRDENGQRVASLSELFPGRIKQYGLGANTRIRGHVPPNILEIGFGDITTDDILLMADELDLNDTASYVLDALVSSFGEEYWLAAFAKMSNANDVPEGQSVAAWANKAGVQIQAAKALRRRISRITNCDYVKPNPGRNSIHGLVKALEAGQSAILSFGDKDRDLDHLLVGNVLSRLVGARWKYLADVYRSSDDDSTAGGVTPPPQLVIVVEEAHIFLNQKVATQTTFGRLAREMRKSFCTLMVVDQMPDRISDLVTSQLGTRFVTWLGDEDSIKAATAGVSNPQNLRRMITSLSQQQEAVMFGWGIPMPIAIRVCAYDETFVQSI